MVVFLFAFKKNKLPEEGYQKPDLTSSSTDVRKVLLAIPNEFAFYKG